MLKFAGTCSHQYQNVLRWLVGRGCSLTIIKHQRCPFSFAYSNLLGMVSRDFRSRVPRRRVVAPSLAKKGRNPAKNKPQEARPRPLKSANSRPLKPQPPLWSIKVNNLRSPSTRNSQLRQKKPILGI